MIRRSNRGYWVSRQRGGENDPYTWAIDIAYSSDSSTPQDNVGPNAVPQAWPVLEGYHPYPNQAVEAALSLKESMALALGVVFTLTTQGKAEIKTAEELKAWAESKYNGLPEPPKESPPPEPLSEEERLVLDRYHQLLREDRVRVLPAHDPEPYDDSYLKERARCEEELEELQDDLRDQIEQHGVWGLRAEIYRKGRWEEVHSVWGILGPVPRQQMLDSIYPALRIYDAYLLKQIDKAARKLGKRATYAGPLPDEPESGGT